MTTLLQADGLVREVDGRRIVDDVSFEIARGEVVALLGPSGAGKSSLLRLLNRLDEPTGGRVLLDGADTRGLAPTELRRRVGLVLQTPRLFPGTVADNVRWGPRTTRGVELPGADVDRLLARVGLDGAADRDVDRLSGGEAQRVSLARTLAGEPEVLLLDEPTSALDQRLKEEIEQTLTELFTYRDLTCLVITHDEAQAARLAERALVMRDGAVVADGPIREVLDA